MADTYITLDKIKWWVQSLPSGRRLASPICPIHNLGLKGGDYDFSLKAYALKCIECDTLHKMPRNFADEQRYAIDKVDSIHFKNLKFINLDDEAIPIAEEKIKENSEYFITSLLTKSKVGLRLVVYAGKKGSDKKTQIFVEPEIKRLAFDQKDLHPTDVFTKVEATFSDGTTASQKKNENK